MIVAEHVACDHQGSPDGLQAEPGVAKALHELDFQQVTKPEFDFRADPLQLRFPQGFVNLTMTILRRVMTNQPSSNLRRRYADQLRGFRRCVEADTEQRSLSLFQ